MTLNIVTHNTRGALGPAKVVSNLLKGLASIGYPHVVNAAVSSTPLLYIPNHVEALFALRGYRGKAVVGPNLVVRPAELPRGVDLSRCQYVVPSDWSREMWLMQGFTRCPLVVWPTGVDLDEFSPQARRPRDKVVLYHKRRRRSELEVIMERLRRRGIGWRLIEYGHYKEPEFKDALGGARFVVWHGCHESQGFALLECLASGVPVLVCDVNSVLDEQPHRESWERGVEKIRATCAPYFDERCGLKITRLGDFDAGLDQVLANERRFAPRSYMEESFSLAHRARQFISMYGGDTPQAPAAGCLGTAGRFKVPLEAYPYLGRRKFMSMFHRLNVKLRRLKPFIKDPPMAAH